VSDLLPFEADDKRNALDMPAKHARIVIRGDQEVERK